MYLGFDRFSYPGDALMQSLWDSFQDVTFVCLYLAPAPSHPDQSWMNAAPQLQAMGWGLLPTYVGQQVIGAGSHTVTPGQGKADAVDASNLAANAGLSDGSFVYLDIENGGQMPTNQVEYVKAWIRELHTNSSYWAGVYCSYFKTAQQVADSVADVVDDTGQAVATWVYHPIDKGPSTIDLGAEPRQNPANSGYVPALAWQYRMSMNGPINLTWVDRNTGAGKRLDNVDLDAANVWDPAHPGI